MSTWMKPTVRPWLSVSRPSSSICKRMLNTSRMRLLDLVEQHDLIGPAPHRLGQSPASRSRHSRGARR